MLRRDGELGVDVSGAVAGVLQVRAVQRQAHHRLGPLLAPPGTEQLRRQQGLGFIRFLLFWFHGSFNSFARLLVLGIKWPSVNHHHKLQAWASQAIVT